MKCAEVATLAPLYLSGELDAERSAAVAAHLQICAGCAREIEQQRDLDARVRAALLAELTDGAALQPGIRRRIKVAEAKRRVLALGLLAAGMFLTAGLLFYRFAAPPVSTLAGYAARDHRREVVEKQVKKWRSQTAEIEALADRQGISAAVIPALAAAGYRLDRARLCRLGSDIYMHLVYTDGSREMSVFLRPRHAEPVPLRAESMGAEHVVAVQSSRLTVLCVAEEAQAAMNLARSAATL
jgi:anti-sigma factor RsiW